MNTSEKGIALIKYFEGVLARPYKCPGGYWTVGVGHLITRNAELHDTWDRKLELDEIDALLKKDLEKFQLSEQFKTTAQLYLETRKETIDHAVNAHYRHF